MGAQSYMGSPRRKERCSTRRRWNRYSNFQDVGLIYRESNDIKNPFSKEIPQVTMTVAKLAGTNAVFPQRKRCRGDAKRA